MVSRYLEPLVWSVENPGATRVYRELKSDMTRSRAFLDAMVEEKLGRLLRYAIKHVPFYKQDELCSVVDRESPLDALVWFPVLAKQDIQRLGNELRGSDQRGAKLNHSGGSTGHILNYYQGPSHHTHAVASRRLGYTVNGWRPGQPRVFFWGSPPEPRPRHKQWLGQVRDSIYGVRLYNAFAPDEKVLKRVTSHLVRRPALLVGYASSLGHLARFLKESGRTVMTLSVQATADTLTDGLRDLLREVFQSEVFNRYGSRELSIVAHEWYDHEGLYVFERNNYVEILDDEGQPCEPGIVGRIVVTSLNNYAMPFIRYDIGDVGYWYAGKERPVSQLRRLGNVVGRENDLIYGPSGTAIYCEFFARLFYSTTGTDQFQVIQDDRAHLTVKVVTRPDVDRSSLQAYLRGAIHRHADPGFKIDFEFPDHIPTTPSGKRRYVYRQSTGQEF